MALILYKFRVTHSTMLKSYFKIVFRSLKRNSLFSFINIIGLTIGISTSLVIYLIVHYDFTFDKFHKDSDRIYRVVSNFSFEGQPGYNSGVSGPVPNAVRTQVTGVQASAPFFILRQTDTYVDGKAGQTKYKQQNDIIVADKAYFDIFQYKWLAGSAASALNEPNQVVLTSDRAEKYFPGLSYDQMVGRTIVYDSIRTTVTGIVRSIKQHTDFPFNDFISFATTTTNRDLGSRLSLNNWGGTSPERQLLVKLMPGMHPAQIERQLNDLLQKNEPKREDNKGNTHSLHLQPLADIHFDANYGTFSGRVASVTTLYELFAIAAFILLLGCINFINLTTAQGSRRAREIGIRKTMGSSRGQLIGQFLMETFVITLISVIISVVMAPAILKFFSDFVPADVDANVFGQPAVVIFLLVLTIIVSLASGFYPALVLSGYKPVSVLKSQSQISGGQTKGTFLRKSLTVAQFGIAQFFIIATLLVSKQIYYAVHKDLGFKKDAIIIINSPWKNRTAGLNKIFLNKLNMVPQVQLVSVGRDAPTSNDGHSTQVTYRDGKKEIKTEISLKYGDENYISVYHIKLLAGRDLQAGDTSKALLINQTYARMIGFKDPHDAVDKQLDDFNGDTPMKIAGVVSDFQQESIHAPIVPLAILTSTNKYFNGTFHIALKPEATAGDWQKAIASVKRIYKSLYPDDDFEYQFFDESIAHLYDQEQRTSALLSWAMGLSIFISCIGLFGLAVYTTARRTKEIGVRKVLGATVMQIVTLLSTEMVALVVLAFAIVTPVVWYVMNQWMQNFAEHTSLSWWVFVLSCAGMLFIALLTLSFQTVKAAIANPANSLRTE
jgi:predicted permease